MELNRVFQSQLPFTFSIVRSSFVISLVFCSLVGLTQDLPNPPSNIKTLVADSYVIPMDNGHQSITYVPSQQGSVYDGFNLKAYGLVYELLEKGIPVKWVIKAGKDKNDPDISDEFYQVFPNAGIAAYTEFRGSSFVVDFNDLVEQSACNPNNPTPIPDIETIISDYGNDVAVYRNVSEISIDVRYTLRLAPKVAVMSDGDYDYEQTEIFDRAGVPYTVLSNQDFFESSECFTFVSQPHIEEEGVDVDYANILSTFVQNGGNFFAQCVGLTTYENIALYQTTGGLENIDGTVWNASYYYLNDDLAIMQFDGGFPDNTSGMTGSYGLMPGSSWRSNAYRAITVGNPSDGEVLMSGADINGALPGGNMIYCGGHAFNDGVIVGEQPEITFASRILLNAAFVPANINFACAGNDVCICPGESVVLGCADPLNGVSFSWSPAAGLSCINCPNPIASPSQTTTYTMMPSEGFCGASTVTVTVLEDNPIGVNVAAACSTDESNYTLSFDITGGDPASYQVIGDGILTGTTFESAPVLAGESYSFEIIDASGCSYFVEGQWYCCAALATMSGDGEICSSGDSATIQIDFQGSGNWEFTYAVDGIAQPPVTTNTSPYVILASEQGVFSMVSVFDDNCQGNILGSVAVSYAASGYAGRNVELSLCYNEDAVNVIGMMNNPDANGVWELAAGQEVGDPFDFVSGIFDPYRQNEGALVYYYIVDSPDCPPDTATINVEILDCPCISPPEPNILAGEFVFCGIRPDEIKFAIEAMPKTRVLWYDTPAADSIISVGWGFKPTEPGIYYAQVVNVPFDGCRGQLYPFNYTIVDKPYVQTIEDSTVYLVQPIRLSTYAYSSHTTNLTYSWSDDLGLMTDITIQSPIVFPNATNTYYVTVMDDLGCSSRDSVTIEFINNLFIPNVFTPNNDGVNDVFRPYSHSVAKMSLKVYSRNGGLVFATETSDISKGWDGTSRGKPMNPGVFVYMMELTYFDGETLQLSGDVTILK